MLSHAVDGSGKALFDWARERELEGIMAKRKESVYRPGERTDDWLKVKNVRDGRFWVLGYVPSPGRTLGSLVVAQRHGDGFLVVGRVSSGLNRDYERRLLEALEPGSYEDLISHWGVIYNPPSRKEIQKIRWVKPHLGVEVSYTEMTPEKKLRHPVFKGLMSGEKTATEEAVVVRVGDHEVRLTHLDKVYWPEDGYTKRDLIEYYHSVSQYLLPHLKDRPLSLVRFPGGVSSDGFYQKDAPQGMPEWVRIAPVMSKEKEDYINFILCDTVSTLVWMANGGAIEINPWLSRYTNLITRISPSSTSILQKAQLGKT